MLNSLILLMYLSVNSCINTARFCAEIILMGTCLLLYLQWLLICTCQSLVTLNLIVPINADILLDISYSIFYLLYSNNYTSFKDSNLCFSTILNNWYLFKDQFLTCISGEDNSLYC